MSDVNIWKTTVPGVGPWCIDFPDGEVITTKSEERARLIAGVETQRATMARLEREAKLNRESADSMKQAWHAACAGISTLETRLAAVTEEKDKLTALFDRHRAREKHLAEIVWQHIKHGDEQHQAWLRRELVTVLCREDTAACTTFDALVHRVVKLERALKDLLDDCCDMDQNRVAIMRAQQALQPPAPVRQRNCPTCNSPAPHLHPAMQHEGEVQPCPDPWHARND